MDYTAERGGMDISFGQVWVAFVIGALTVILLLTNRKSKQIEEDLPAPRIFVPRGFTEDDLSRFRGTGPRGSDEEQVFVSVKGIVYSVAHEWYGPKGAYHDFSGCDASRQLGKVKVSREEINTDWTCLSAEHLLTLNEWEERFKAKYTPVGWFIPGPTYYTSAAHFDP